MMTKPFFDNTKSRDIFKGLLNPSLPDISEWSPGDLRAMLIHLLETPLVCELERLADLSCCSRTEASSVLIDSGCQTFGDLLRADRPSITALKMVKDYAKASLAQEGDLPRDVVRVLYVLAILRGRQIEPGGVSSLDDANIEREARRCLTFGWLPADIRKLLHHYINV